MHFKFEVHCKFWALLQQNIKKMQCDIVDHCCFGFLVLAFFLKKKVKVLFLVICSGIFLVLFWDFFGKVKVKSKMVANADFSFCSG